jgi:UDP-glucose 4-epimerase
VRVAITGGAGFIGANLARTLLDDERIHGVAVVDDLSTGRRENLEGLDVDLHVGTILDPAVLDATFDGVEAIVHLAARPSVPRSLQDPVASHHANATGTIEVLEAARRIGRPHVIVASSSSVYGANPTLPKSEDLRTQPLSPYAVSKLATEAYALAYANCFELPVLAFRFFNVFGPLQPAGHAYAAALPAFIDAALRGQPIPIDGDGEQTRDFTYVGSVAAAIREALVRKLTSDDPVNLAFGTRRSILEAVAELEAVVGGTLEREHRPARAGDVRHSQADGTRLHELLPDVEPVDFRIGLEATVGWFRTLPEYRHLIGDEGVEGVAYGVEDAQAAHRASPSSP